MTKQTMIEAIINIHAMMGEYVNPADFDNLNYKQTREEFLAALQDMNSYQPNLDINNEEDEDAEVIQYLEQKMQRDGEEINLTTEQMMVNHENRIEKDYNENGMLEDQEVPWIRAIKFLEYINFKSAVNEQTLAAMSIVKVQPRVYNIWIEGEYYKANNQRMYKFMKAVHDACKEMDAAPYFERPAYGQSYLQVKFK